MTEHRHEWRAHFIYDSFGEPEYPSGNYECECGSSITCDKIEEMLNEYETLKQKRGGEILYMDLGRRLIERIVNASDMDDPENHDIELALVRILAHCETLKRATETLSAEDARCIGYQEIGCSFLLYKLRDYAQILSGDR